MQAIRFLKISGRSWALAIAIALIAGCAGQNVQPQGPASAARAEALYQSGDYAAAAKMYQRLADAAPREAKAPLLLRAGEAWAQAKRPDAALQALNAVPAGALTGQNHVRHVLLSAGLDLATHRPQAALDALNALPAQLPDATKATALKVRGQTLFALGNPVAAIEALTERAGLLQAPDAVAANRELIWHGLTQAHQSLTALILPPDVDPAVAGWLALGEIGRTAWQAPYRFAERVAQWQQQFAQHPANGRFVQQLLQAHARRIAYPSQIALLLPLDGRLSAVAAAVRDGLLAARYTHGARQSGNAAPPVIRLYDTAGDPVAAYQQAVADGAKVVVGPLSQDALTKLVQADAITVPTLALTDLPVNPAASPSAETFRNGFVNFFGIGPTRPAPPAHPMLYQFGFQPTDEARQAAERAVRDGRMRGVVLAPATPYGQHMIDAFRQRLEALGGSLLEARQYQLDDQSDVATPIKQILNLDRSRMRARALESVLRRNVTYQPRRREDVQFIFLVADNGQARLIRPQIRFHRGLGLPVYATSAVYEPDSNPEFDLNGVMFTDMPWVLSDEEAIATVRQQLRRLWPDRYDAVGRYYALGYDAYRLVPLITHLDQPLTSPVRGVTGILTIDSRQRIHREYDWAMYKGGHVQALAHPR
ncbi:MAG TPA: penicillin-binding protein activator [Gammaproteobacteria bacterium]|nr:penicillin-binding protein activator [Gammaproteobacteria bacterium]